MIKHRPLKYVMLGTAIIALAQLTNVNSAEAKGKTFNDSYYESTEGGAANAGVPDKITLYPQDSNFHQHASKIYNDKSLYGNRLPYIAKDSAGNSYPALCIQSGAANTKSVSYTGEITDQRFLDLASFALVSAGNGFDSALSEEGQGRLAALNMVTWGALNKGFPSDLFTNNSKDPLSDNANAYGNKWAGEVVQLLKKEYDDMYSMSAEEYAAKKGSSGGNAQGSGVRVSTSIKTSCGVGESSGEVTGQFAEVKLTDESGNPIDASNLNVDIPGFNLANTSDPATVERMKEAGITPEPGKVYLDVPPDAKAGTYTSTPSVKDASGNDLLAKSGKQLRAFMYGGGGGGQPYVIFKYDEGSSQPQVNVKWGCDAPPPMDLDQKDQDIPVRWYNIPSAFGEIKDGVGYNPQGVTTSGGYAGSRSSEEFEAMLGVPSTERFYVNLGGTEGVLDVEYTVAKREREFGLSWQTLAKWWVPTACGEGESGPCGYYDYGTKTHQKKINWKLDAMNLTSATFRSMADGTVTHAELGISTTVPNTDTDPGSFTLIPKASGLDIGPAVGIDTYNIGATKNFQRKTFYGQIGEIYEGHVSSVPEDFNYGVAAEKANANIGELFVQNDHLTINLQGKEYTFSLHEINQKKDKVFHAFSDNEKVLSATNEEFQYSFKPLKEKWDVWGEIDIKGYTGNATADSGRNSKGTPLIVENIPVPIQLENGIYDFSGYQNANFIEYESMATSVKGGVKPLQNSVSGLLPQGGYTNELNPTDPSSHISGNKVLTHYTNWQVPVASTKSITFNHSGKKPDGNHSSSLGDNPTYPSLNPVLIHNPTTAMYSWIGDVNEAQLQDQRIEGANTRIKDHPSATQGVARQYVDFDFTMFIPNDAAFRTYWGQTSSPSDEAGIVDPDFTASGTIGKSYNGQAEPQNTGRNPSVPYGSAWDVSKWINAKYVKFPYKVCDLDDNRVCANYYEANTWIKLYDDGKYVKSGDPTSFDFHVTSDQKDIKNGVVYVVTEAINAPAGLAGNPDALYADAEQYVNGTRQQKSKYGAARYSAANQINVDLIGRIGNVVVSDTSDPSWTGVFWKTEKGKVDVKSKVRRNYGSYFNYYEDIVAPNSTTSPAYDRFNTVGDWLGDSSPMHTLPVTTNIFTKGKENQTIKLGYNIGGSLQTVGDYDYKVWVYPHNKLAGDFKTGTINSQFKLITSDPYSTGNRYQEYYDSAVNNTLTGEGILGLEYKPAYEHKFAISLADPRVKLSDWEKKSTSYQKAVQAGVSKKTILGTPSMMVLDQTVRTLVGNDDTTGNWGGGNHRSGQESNDCPCSYENSQKWNWNYSLPQNTSVWFGKTSSRGMPILETPDKGQYLITSMTFRTKVERTTFPGQGQEWQADLKQAGIPNDGPYLASSGQSLPDWDLTTYTNKGVSKSPDIVAYTKNTPTDKWDPSQGGSITNPSPHIVWWDYSNQSTTDKDTIGTH